MPLLHKKTFVRKRPPVGVSSSDKVFYCELTNEAFLDYDEYWERLVLCNAMVWTCEITGRPNLTYQEALDSEAKGIKFFASITPALKIPLLYLASLTRRGRQADVSEDVFNHCRDRYFPGECVEAIVNKHWYDCKVVRVIYPTAEEVALYEKQMADSDEECMADSVTPSSSAKTVPVDPLNLGGDGSESKPICLDDDEDSSPDSEIQVIALKSPTQSKHNTPVKAGSPSKKGLGGPPYATFKYEVEEELAWDYKTCRRHIVSWEQIRRSKNIFTREKCKLLLKVSTELTPDGFWQLKSNVSRKYSIKSRSYSDFFPGPAPKFEESRSKKLPLSLSPRGKDAHLRQQKKENKEAKLRDKKEEKLNKSNNDDSVAKKRGRPSLSGEEKLTRKLERIKTKQTELNFNASSKPKPVISPEEAERNRQEQQKIIEQRQQHFAEMKEILRLRIQKEKAEKKQERDVKKEQRKLLALEMKDWLKPREDLTCGDHKNLPTPVPVACGVPNHLFGSFLSLLEFLNSFSEVLELHDVYPHGISFEMLENAIVTKEVAGVFNDVVQLLLGAVFSLQEEEDEEITADTTVDASASLTADAGENDQRAAAVKFANVASRWASQHHSTSLHQLPLDALTLTEVVRLHILSSGADNANAQWRHFNRGGYKHLDDPGLQFKLDEPQIVKDLSVKSVFDHNIEDKLKLLQLLMNQILTYASVRDRLEESFDKIREVKMALREHQLSYKQMEKEEHAARVLKKKESRQKKLKQPQGAPGSALPAESEQLPQPAEEEQEDEEERKEREEKLEKVREKRKLEHSKKEAELLDQLLTLSAKTNPISLGEDRAHRRYWVFASVSGLFVEDDDPFPGTCYDVATKDVVDVRPEACGDTLARLQREAKQIVAPEENIEEKANTSDKENDTSALGSPQVNGSAENTNVNGPTENVKLNGATGDAKIAENVANTITRVILTPPPSVIANKLVKSTNMAIHNTPKSVQKSSKDRSITMFFSKSPKCSAPLLNGDVSPQDSTEDKLSVKADPDHSSSPVTNLSNSEPEKVDDELVNGAVEEVKAEQPDAEVGVFGLCTANADTCPVHTLNTKRSKWSFFHKEEDIQALVDGLNDRGERESVLKENILLYRSKIENDIKNCPVFILSPTDSDPDTIVRKSKRTGGKKGGDADTNLNFPIGTPIDHILEVTLRDMILEVEEKLFVGVLGRLQVPDRDIWRQCVVGEGDGKLDARELTWGGKLRIAKFKASLGIETHSPSGSNNTSGDEVALSEEELRTSVVRQLSVAVLQVAQSVDVKYLKPPLAETEKVKKKRCKAENRLRKLVEKRDKEREEQQQQQQKLENGANNSDDSDSESEMGDSREINAIPDNSLRLPIERWELSLMSSVSFSQIFLHLATLDNSVTWSRSLTKTRCRICRKGGDHDKMLLCDGCDKGHHIYCLKPKLKSIPAGDWFCDKCKPKIKAKSPKKNRTIYIEEEDEEEAEEVHEEKEEEEEEECPNDNEGDQADNEQADNEQADEDEEEEEDGGFEDDVCDSCLTGGTLICCDTCPRSFHQECVMLKKIPRGTWSCPECIATPGERSKRSKAEEKTSKKNDEQSKAKRTSESRKKVSIEGSQRSSSRRSAPSSPGDDDTEVLPSKRRRLDRTPEGAVDAPVANGRGSKRSLPLDTDDLHTSVLHTLLSDITAQDDAWPFLKPVNKKQVPDYYQVVKKPMDLQTMKEKLNSNKYSTDAQFLADGLLVFQNCQQYNMEDTDEFQAGANLSAFFKKRARQLGLDVIRAEEDDAPAKPKRTSAVKKKKHST